MKEVKLYFKNENDAHSAQSTLNKYRISNVSMEEMNEGNRTGLFIPIFSPYWGTGSGTGGGGLPFFGGGSNDDSDQGQAQEADSKYMSHMLRFEIEEEDYEQAISELKEYDPYGMETDNNR